MKKHRARWSARPTPDDFEAAERYLSLQFRASAAAALVNKARALRASQHVAKDILRACGLPLQPTDELHVGLDLKRIHKGKPISPIILIQGDLLRGHSLVIADGYHRLCAACHADEDSPVRGILVPS